MNSVVILDGLNASGKTFCAETLSELLPAPIIRPFRENNEHLGREDKGAQENLHKLGIPANTFVDDAYTSDFLVQTGVSAVLDRSMGSGIAYGLLYGNIANMKHARELLSLWQESITRYNGNILYVYMIARKEVRKKRCKAEGRWHPNASQDKLLYKVFDLVFRCIEFEKILVDSSDIAQECIGPVVAKKIIKRLR